jgi:signal transduction histidine kinase
VDDVAEHLTDEQLRQDSCAASGDQPPFPWPLAAGLLVLQLLTFVGARHDSGTELALDVLALAVGLLAVPVLVRSPVHGTVAFGLMAALSPVATPPATAAVFWVAQSRPFRTATAVAVVGVAGHLVLASWRPVEGLPFGWWAVLVVIAYGLLIGWGAYVQARRALVSSLRERARQAEATQAQRVAEGRRLERHRIAREMHDVLAHRLSLVSTHAGALEYRPDSAPERIAAAAGVVRAGVHQALEELREVILVLRDEDDDGEGAIARPQPTLAELPALVEESRAVGVHVELLGPGELAAVPATIGRAAYRVVQEGLTNARRHAPGRPVRVEVTVRPDEGVEVLVTNPVADRPQAPSAGAGIGLIGLSERVALVGGTLTHRQENEMFTLCAWLPWGS